MKQKNVIAIFFAVLASALYAINMPLSKLLLNHIGPTMMASYLYLGAGIGIGILYLLSKKENNINEKITKKDLPFVIGMVILDILAPIFLMFGLKTSASSSASLLNNFEIVCTSLIALFIFKEVISKKMWIAIMLITLSSFALSLNDISSFTFSFGSFLVLLATLCWGMENNCTRNLSSKNTYLIVFIKGIFSGLGSLVVALILKEDFSNILYISLALLLGFVAYGLSIFFYIKAQGIIGAARTSAYYSISPFIGTFLSFIILKESLSITYFIGLVIMILGTILVVLDTLTKKHNHMHTHTYTHTHDGNTHTHEITHEHEHSHIINENVHSHYHKFK
jgi:drug/metabolite transporter (DMT)-like permease